MFVTTASGSENTLTNGGEYIAIDENKIDAVIFSKSDLTVNGEGTLTIEAKAGHGMVSKDDLALTSGTYTITAAGQGLSGKNSVRIADGTYQITAGKDAVHVENTEDATTPSDVQRQRKYRAGLRRNIYHDRWFYHNKRWLGGKSE